MIPKVYDGRGRTFWFVSAETVNGSAASVDLNPTVPIEPWRRGDFSALGRPIRNPLTGEVYTDGRIPDGGVEPRRAPDSGALLSVAELRQHRGASGQQLPRDAGDRAGEAVLRDRARRPQLQRVRSHLRPVHAEPDDESGMGRQSSLVRHAQQFRQDKALTLFRTRAFSARRSSTSSAAGHAYNNNPIAGPVNGLEVVESLGLRGLAPGLPDIGGVLKVSFPGAA